MYSGRITEIGTVIETASGLVIEAAKTTPWTATSSKGTPMRSAR